MGCSQSREILVTYEEHNRLVPLENYTHEALRDGFISTFKDVLPISEEHARDMVMFQKYNRKIKEYVDIEPDDRITGGSRIKAKFHSTRIGTSYPLMNNHIYYLWSLGSYQGNGFLRRTNEQGLKADGDGTTTECEWLAHKLGSPTSIYWAFSNPDNDEVLAVIDGNVVLEDQKQAGTSSQFLPSFNGRYKCFSPRDNNTTQKTFLGADGDGNVRLVLNAEPNPGRFHNPTPQTLFIPYFIRKE